jgi:uncharacterized protein YbaR (Trm112 family)
MAPDPTYSDFAIRFAGVRELLGCPACQGPLRLDGEGVACTFCARKYPVVDGIPMLIAEPTGTNELPLR